MTRRVGRAVRRGVITMMAFTLGLAVVVVGVLDTTPADAEDGVQGVICAPLGATPSRVGVYGPEQMGNARVIVEVGRERGIGETAMVIALMAAMTESGLRNLPYGDRDSLGLFQMRPSQGWGTPEQILDPRYSANKFYEVLLTVPGWQSMPPGAAAQAVERSAHPDRYATHEQAAREVLGALDGTPCTPARPRGESVSLPENPRAEQVINAALAQVGVRYAWGGGDANGPTVGHGVDAGVTGFDCSGLALYAYARIGVAVPHQTQAIWAAFQPAITDRAALQPADLILLSNNGKHGGIHHVGIYLGGGRVVHAPQSGDRVRVVDNIWTSAYWTREFIGAVRPGTT
jgi:cell wall-associated NlpC family hydrolase